MRSKTRARRKRQATRQTSRRGRRPATAQRERSSTKPSRRRTANAAPAIPPALTDEQRDEADFKAAMELCERVPEICDVATNLITGESDAWTTEPLAGSRVTIAGHLFAHAENGPDYTCAELSRVLPLIASLPKPTETPKTAEPEKPKSQATAAPAPATQSQGQPTPKQSDGPAKPPVSQPQAPDKPADAAPRPDTAQAKTAKLTGEELDAIHKRVFSRLRDRYIKRCGPKMPWDPPTPKAQ